MAVLMKFLYSWIIRWLRCFVNQNAAVFDDVALFFLSLSLIHKSIAVFSVFFMVIIEQYSTVHNERNWRESAGVCQKQFEVQKRKPAAQLQQERGNEEKMISSSSPLAREQTDIKESKEEREREKN